MAEAIDRSVASDWHVCSAGSCGGSGGGAGTALLPRAGTSCDRQPRLARVAQQLAIARLLLGGAHGFWAAGSVLSVALLQYGLGRCLFHALVPRS